MLASIIPILALFFFNDNRSLGIESEAHNRTCAVTEGGPRLSQRHILAYIQLNQVLTWGGVARLVLHWSGNCWKALRARAESELGPGMAEKRGAPASSAWRLQGKSATTSVFGGTYLILTKTAVCAGQSATTGSIDTKAPPKPSRQRPHLWCWSEASIPYILSCSDIIYGLASGCTIKYCPLQIHLVLQITNMGCGFGNATTSAAPSSLSLA